MVYSRETAAAITIVANSTAYDAQVVRLTCFIDRQGKATIRHAAAYEPEPRKELLLGTGLGFPLWETLWLMGLTVSKLTFSLRAASTADL